MNYKIKVSHIINMKKIFKYNNLLFIIPLIIIITYSFIDMYYLSSLNSLYQYHFIKEIIFVIIGFILMVLISYLKPKKLLKLSPYLYYFSIFLLILVLFIGNNTNGSKAWFNFFFIKIQPSEITKLTLILYLSYLKNNNNTIYLIRIIIITLIPSILVFLEPDTGAVIIYLLIMLSFIYSKKVKDIYKIIITFIIILLSISFLLIYHYYKKPINNYFNLNYRIKRITNINEGYQITNAKTAIGLSKPFSLTINKPILYIPEAPTDFIFAFTAANFGFISGLIIIISYFFITLFIIYKKSNSLFTIFCFQVVYNIGFNIGILPIMGIPLPFLSYGGSNIIIYFLLFGILISMDDNNSYNHSYKHLASY